MLSPVRGTVVRVTTRSFYAETLRNIERGFSDFAEAQRRASTGLRVERPSDDPGATTQILRSSEELRATGQYRRNIDDARSRIGVEESALSSLTDILSRAKELATGEAGDSGSAQTRLAAKLEIDQLFSATVALGNTYVEGAYLFGGVYSDQKPFDAVGAPSATMPPVGEHQTQISELDVISTNHDGQSVFLDSTAFAALQNLSTALGANDSGQIQAALTGVDTAFQNVQTVFVETGARSNRLEQADQTLSLREFDLTQRRSNLQDSDLAAVAIDIASRQVVLESAMAAASRAFGLTLNQYLR